MKIAKFEHACFVVEKDGRTLVVDPGNLTSNLTRLQNVDAIVITHQHADHIDTGIITAIMDENPTAEIFATAAVVPNLSLYTVHIARPDGRASIGNFDLRFFGGTHATIHSSLTPVDNIGVLINEKIYYPGDSFALPDRSVQTLLLPIAAPWMKLSEALDFALSLRSPIVIPTHDKLLSPIGLHITEGHITRIVEEYGGRYIRPIDPLELPA